MSGIQTFLSEYLIRLTRLKIGDILEILIIAMVIYYFLQWIKTTNAWAVLKGLAILFLCWLISYIFNLYAIQWIFTNAVGVGITAIVILFQPELRKVLEQLGKKEIMPALFGNGESDKTSLSDKDIDEMVKGVYQMAKTKTGALIIFEAQIDIQKYVRGGVSLDADISSELLLSIFTKDQPMHDGATLIRGGKMVAAGCFIEKLSDNMQLDKDLGTRHRAAVGISEVATDSFTIVVSEESGKVSTVRNGELIRGRNADELREELQKLRKMPKKEKGFRLFGKKEKPEYPEER